MHIERQVSTIWNLTQHEDEIVCRALRGAAEQGDSQALYVLRQRLGEVAGQAATEKECELPPLGPQLELTPDQQTARQAAAARMGVWGHGALAAGEVSDGSPSFVEDGEGFKEEATQPPATEQASVTPITEKPRPKNGRRKKKTAG